MLKLSINQYKTLTMNADRNVQSNNEVTYAILNANVVKDEKQKDVLQSMGISSCQVACMSYKCCTGHGRGGKHIQHSYKISN